MEFSNQSPHREIVPLASKDCFLIFDRTDHSFDFPVHFHPEYELNFIYNGQGIKRIVGDHTAEIEAVELVLVGPNLSHGWMLHRCTETKIHEVTIQFHNDLLQEKLLNRAMMRPIREMFKNATQGILFSKETALKVYPMLKNLSKLHGLDCFLALLSILHLLGFSKGQKKLSGYAPVKQDFYSDGKMKIIYDYVQKNFSKKIKVQDVAMLINMTEVSFSRFIKKRTDKTFVEYLNDVRIGFAAQWLIEKETSIAEIAYHSGFNNVSNFNRIFKAKKGCTPSEYRRDFEHIEPFRVTY